jgi:hypothetical protein
VIFTGNISIDTFIYSICPERCCGVIPLYMYAVNFWVLGIQLDRITFYRQSRGSKSNRSICTSGLFNELAVLSAVLHHLVFVYVIMGVTRTTEYWQNFNSDVDCSCFSRWKGRLLLLFVPKPLQIQNMWNLYITQNWLMVALSKLTPLAKSL